MRDETRATTGRRLRICFVGTHARDPDRYPSGSQAIAQGLAARGHVVRLTSQRRGRPARLHEIYTTVRRGRADFDVVLIDTYSTQALWYARMASKVARRVRLPAVALLHGGGLPQVAVSNPARLRRHLMRVERVVAPSAYLAREVGQALGVDVTIIPHPIRLGDYPQRTRTSAAPRLAWVRAFSSEYRPDDAVRLVARLAADYADTTLVMAGPEKDGSLARCRKLAAELGVSERIEFPGLIDKEAVRALGAKTDVFLNTTSVDNTPVSIVEAMAMGHCIVSTDVGGIPDLLNHEQTALLYPAGNLGAAHSAVRRILGDASLAERLSSGALAAAQQFDQQRGLDTWESLLFSISDRDL